MASIYKKDCKWYDYWQDMGARIPFCKAGKNMDASGFFLETCDGCKDYGSKNVTTNADRIRAAADEEMADELLDYFAAFYSVEWSREELIEWLKQEAGDG